ncbi:HNH endonuclease [candidate division WOR-3 bacterium]|nr:HNH endonuclease [candidate division WOR-3 bacterium]
MSLLSSSQKEAIIRRRSDKDGRVHRITNLEIHHKDRNTNNNDPRNLRVLTIKEHDELHRRAGY